jgi:hypothetical protein
MVLSSPRASPTVGMVPKPCPAIETGKPPIEIPTPEPHLGVRSLADL